MKPCSAVEKANARTSLNRVAPGRARVYSRATGRHSSAGDSGYWRWCDCLAIVPWSWEIRVRRSCKIIGVCIYEWKSLGIPMNFTTILHLRVKRADIAHTNSFGSAVGLLFDQMFGEPRRGESNKLSFGGENNYGLPHICDEIKLRLKECGDFWMTTTFIDKNKTGWPPANLCAKTACTWIDLGDRFYIQEREIPNYWVLFSYKNSLCLYILAAVHCP